MTTRSRLSTAAATAAAAMLLAVACEALAETAIDSRGIAVVGPNQVSAAAVAAAPRPGYALLIGASQYRSPRWNDLTAIPGELAQVREALQRQGFVVETEVDLPANELFRITRQFIASRGSSRENRLLFYFAGHGYSRNDGQNGYFVPVDAPHPSEDLRGFLAQSLDMTQFIAWARQIESAQALFVFDSCFSGTVLQQRGDKPQAGLIQRLWSEPVRQFITAGGAGDSVPARSDFTPAFVAALDKGLADLNGDGFITATELGMHLQGQLGQHGRQTPWFGKLPDPAFARGDFVFRSSKGAIAAQAHDPSPPLPASPRLADLAISSTPSGATVFVDGRLLGVTPVTLTDQPPGRYRLELRTEGHESRHAAVELQANESRQITLRLDPLETVGQLYVRTDPVDARVTIADTTESYRPGLKLPTGQYRITVAASGYRTRELTVDVGDSDSHVYVALERRPASTSVADRERPALHVRSERLAGPSAWTNPVPPTAATCYAQNTLGQPFYWMGPNIYVAQNQAIALCQMNTPMGGFCQLTGCR